MRRTATVAKAAIVSFYHDQGTHHAGALTYYALMSLFPLLLLTISLLGLIGDYPGTYNAIIHDLRVVVPGTVLTPFNSALRTALKSRHTALAAFGLGVVTAFYGSTGYLEATRRALNVVFGVQHGRSFVRRKLTDIGSTVVLLVLVLVTVVLMFAREHVVRDLVGAEPALVWRIARWPTAVLTALLIFSFVYSVTPDTGRRSLRWIAPGAAVGVTIWLLASAGFAEFLARAVNFNATYGSFAAAVVLIVWLWLTNVALFFGAEVNAEIHRLPDAAVERPEPAVAPAAVARVMPIETDRTAPGEELNRGPVAEARPAATVILLRGGDDGLEVLLVKRNPEARFMGGAWVFPGGAVHDGDGAGEPALRAAALRELAEEAGIALEESEELIPFSRWITPAEVRIRFDTWFYLASAPAQAEARVDGEEVVDSRWYVPDDALKDARAGELLLVFPTIKQLEQLARFRTAAELMSYAREREVRPVQPRVIGTGETARIVLPGEPGYD